MFRIQWTQNPNTIGKVFRKIHETFNHWKDKGFKIFVCNIEDGSSFPTHFDKPKVNRSIEANVTENSWRLVQSKAFNSPRTGEQVLPERLLSDVHLDMHNLSSFWRRKIDESTSDKLSQLSSVTLFRFGEPATFGHSTSILELLRSSVSKFGRFCNNIQSINQTS
jgi:hypothetical protein